MNKTQDLKTLYILKAKDIKHLIANTNLGPLEVKLNQDSGEYYFTLDSVPVGKEQNRELLKLYGI